MNFEEDLKFERVRFTRTDGGRFDATVIGTVDTRGGQTGLRVAKVPGDNITVDVNNIATLALADGRVFGGPAATLDGLHQLGNDELARLLEEHRQGGPLHPDAVVVSTYDNFVDADEEDEEDPEEDEGEGSSEEEGPQLTSGVPQGQAVDDTSVTSTSVGMGQLMTQDPPAADPQEQPKRSHKRAEVSDKPSDE